MNVSISSVVEFARMGGGYAYEMAYGAIKSRQTTRRFVKTFTPDLRKEIHNNLFRSLHVNVSLVLPVFAAYQRLTGNIDRSMLDRTVVPTLCMLIEDLLLDEQHLSPHEVEKAFEPNTIAHINNPYLLLAHALYHHHITSLAPKHQSKARNLLCKLHNVQSMPVKESDSYEHIQELTDLKGVWLPALLFCINPNMDEHEVIVLKTIGALMKYADDYADRHSDAQREIPTAFSLHLSENDSQVFLHHYKQYTSTQIQQLSYPATKREQFIKEINFLVDTFVLYMNAKSEVRRKRDSLRLFQRPSLKT